MLSDPVSVSTGQRFSIVTAVYNVERYLQPFIASIESQTFPREQFEVIVVDDGSTDGSLAALEAWAERSPGPVRVLSKPNGGQSTARNLGLDHASGEWVTFTDPDDVVNPEYLSEVDAFLRSHPETELVACNMLLLQDATGEVRDTHPLRHRFEGEARVRDLDEDPAYFFVSAPAGFFRRSRIEALGLRFDPRIRPNFEDGHFSGVYLLSLDRPLVGFVPTARYEYRKRGDASSTLNLSVADPRRYSDVFRYGYLDLLQRAAESSGKVPAWLQNLMLYELSWIMTLTNRALAGSTPAVMEVAEEFHEHMSTLLGFLDPEVIEDSPVKRLRRLWRDILLHAYQTEPWAQSHAALRRLDPEQDLVLVFYTYTGRAPQERILSGGQAIQPTFATIRDQTWLGRTVLEERYLWLPAGAPLSIELDGKPLALRFGGHPPDLAEVQPTAIREKLDRNGLRTGRWAPAPPKGLGNRIIRRLARTQVARENSERAWVLMDKVHEAGDSGQRLFEYLRSERPEIDAWFVLERGAPGWVDLRRQHGRRVVAYGSLRWKALMLNAEHLISSHADKPVVAPDALAALGSRPGWRFTFLQHGVIKDDLSSWLNPKRIDNFVTSTRAEYDSIASPHTGYVFTDREVILTGLPRFDRLRTLGSKYPPQERDLVLLAPTWRNWLTLPLAEGSQRRLVTEDFLDSEFTRSWFEVLSSPRLRAAADELGVEVGFLPHPNLQAALREVALPEHVRAFTFNDDVQELFARAAVLVTDYSSMAFNSAYIDRAVVYYQFDRDRMSSGDHVGHRGYFEYERDGYGPVTLTSEEAVDAVIAVLRAGRVPPPAYQARIEAAFPARDGRCCERVTEAILASAQKQPVIPAS